VALSRGRESNRLYVTRGLVLRDGLERSAAHELASEQRRRAHGLER
jgi:hypothetical protein